MSDSEMDCGIDGTTGKLVRTIPLPQAGSNDSIAFANLRGKAAATGHPGQDPLLPRIGRSSA